MKDEIRMTTGRWPDGKEFILMVLVRPRTYRIKRKHLILQNAICWTPKSNDEVIALDFELSPVRMKVETIVE